MKKILIATDFWHPGINGPVRHIENTIQFLKKDGFEVVVLHPGLFKSVSLFFYRDVKIALFPARKTAAFLRQEKPDYIWIATEGTIGRAVRNYCVANSMAFVSSYQGNIGEYIAHYTGIKSSFLVDMAYAYFKWFHKKSAAVMCATKSSKEVLDARGFTNAVVCPLGVNVDLFKRNPSVKAADYNLKAPVFAYFGRLAKEKNIEDFLRCSLPGTKLLIGDGPMRQELQKKYPEAVFVGFKRGQELVDMLSACDVMVFPSTTETFGLVIVEALACGLPVAAYDVMGPKDIISHGVDGFLGEDLQASALACLTLSREACRQKAMQFSQQEAAKAFLAILLLHPTRS